MQTEWQIQESDITLGLPHNRLVFLSYLVAQNITILFIYLFLDYYIIIIHLCINFLASRTRRAVNTDNEVDFTLGVEDCSQIADGDFCNGPLAADTDYMWVLQSILFTTTVFVA